MDLTLLLAKLFGIYFIAIGVALLLKQKEFKATINELADNKHITLIAGMMLFVVGGLVVFNHNIWEGTLAILVSLFGWLIFLKGIAYIVLPASNLRKFMKAINPTLWFGWGGIISLIIGIYMTGVAFSWF